MTQLLNTPLEVGVRVVALLNELYPRRIDISRVVLFDHIALHSEDFSGERSLHPAVPVRMGELGIKRDLIRRGIQLMGSRGLILQSFDVTGIQYEASDDARPFVEALESQYLSRLCRRYAWTVATFGVLDDADIRAQLSKLYGSWSEEFDLIKRSDQN